MAKISKTNVLVIPIVVLLLILPLSSAFGTEEDLKYQIQSAGTCKITLYSTTGAEYIHDIVVTLRTSNGWIYKQFDGRPSLPQSSLDLGNPGINGCGMYGLNYDNLNFWNLAQQGVIEGGVDYCADGLIIDPYPLNGIVEYKCQDFCMAGSKICKSSTTLLVCDDTGSQITEQICQFGCDEYTNICRPSGKILSVDTDQVAYSLGEIILVNGSFTEEGIGVASVGVIAQLIRNSAVLSEQQSFTDSLGRVSFQFNIPSTGETTVKLMVPNYQGLAYGPATKIIQVMGNAITYNVSTFSYTQYSSKGITFLVSMKDARGIDVVPEQIDNLHAVASLSGGKVYSGDITYMGNGLYQVTSNVSGSGKYVGKIAFNFEGLPQSSPVIEINVEPMKVIIDASSIKPGAYLNEPMEYEIKIFDAAGEPLDPDSIFVEISLPSGTKVNTIPFSEITRTGEGLYTFEYTFTEVEKHTFNIYSDYANYSRGSARASIAVSSHGDDFGPGVAGIGTGLTWIFYVGGAALVLYFAFKLGRKRR